MSERVTVVVDDDDTWVVFGRLWIWWFWLTVSGFDLVIVVVVVVR